MTAFSIIFGGIITIATAVFVEYMRRPKIALSIIEATDKNYKDRPAGRTRFIGVIVSNERLPFGVRWMSRNAASRCYGIVSFHHLDGQNVFGRSMEIRWSSAPEPVPIQASVNGQSFKFFDFHRFQASQRVDINPGETETFAVAGKFDTEDECWGWNNESYFCQNEWRNEKWKIEKGRYLVEVSIYSSGVHTSDLFRLINDVSIEDFRLEKATEEDRRNLMANKEVL